MKKLAVTIRHLENHKDGIVSGDEVTFNISQGSKVLIEDKLVGKCTGPYAREYEVNASDEPISVAHNRPDLPWLSITAVPIN